MAANGDADAAEAAAAAAAGRPARGAPATAAARPQHDTTYTATTTADPLHPWLGTHSPTKALCNRSPSLPSTPPPPSPSLHPHTTHHTPRPFRAAPPIQAGLAGRGFFLALVFLRSWRFGIRQDWNKTGLDFGSWPKTNPVLPHYMEKPRIGFWPASRSQDWVGIGMAVFTRKGLLWACFYPMGLGMHALDW